MKITMTKTEVLDYDLDKERERLKGFEWCGDQLERLLKVCDLFEAEKYEELLKFANTWGRCPDQECPEVEYIPPTILQVAVRATSGEWKVACG